MSNSSTLSRQTLEYVRHYPRQLISSEDLNDQVEYVREKLRRHNRLLHGYGIVCGLTVRLSRGTLSIDSGYALSPRGNELVVPERASYEVQTLTQASSPCGCPPPDGPVAPVGNRFIVIGYRECPARPVRVHPAGCGCHDDTCEFARTREWYEVRLLDVRPESHPAPQKDGSTSVDRCTTPPDDWVLLGVLEPAGQITTSGVRTLSAPEATTSAT